MQLPKLVALLAAITFTTASATNMQITSTGPILLRYEGSVLPTGVCKLMECNFQSSKARGFIKDYLYKGVYGNLTVTRDIKMRITAAQYSASTLTSSGVRAEVIKFARGFAGVNLADRNVSDCLNGVNLIGQAVNGVIFEFSCTQTSGQTIVGVVDSSIKQNTAIKSVVPTQSAALSTAQQDQVVQKAEQQRRAVEGPFTSTQVARMCAERIRSLDANVRSIVFSMDDLPRRMRMYKLADWKYLPRMWVDGPTGKYKQRYECVVQDDGTINIDTLQY